MIKVLTTLKDNGYPSFLVGGCVRDLLLGKEPKDYDICTQARPEQVKSLFAKVVDSGIKYGTVTVLTSDISAGVEVTTFRKVVQNPDGPRASEIVFGSGPAEDVLKRDFTINGLLYDGETVVDYVDGQADLKNGVIRGIENADRRFQEDPLRMMRAVRLGCQLGFEIEPETLAAIGRNAALIGHVSSERIRDELVKILLGNGPAAGFRLLYSVGLLSIILPELALCYGFDQVNPHHTQDIFEHIMTVVENTPPDLIIRLAALLHDIGKPLTFSIDEEGTGHFYDHHLKSHELSKKILTRLKFDNKIIWQVSLLIKEHMNRLKNPKCSTLKRLINRVGAANIDALLELQMADVKRPGKMDEVADLLRIKGEIEAVLRKKEPMNPRELAINGDDLMALGIKPGKMMGRILMELTDKVIEDPGRNTRENLLAMAREIQIRRKEEF